MKHVKKTVLEDGYEYVDADQLIDEINDPDFKWFTIAKPIIDVLNYYQENTPDAFGNAPYARLEGFMNGFLAGKGYTLEKGQTLWTVKSGSRRILTIEVPTKPEDYYAACRDARDSWESLFT